MLDAHGAGRPRPYESASTLITRLGEERGSNHDHRHDRNHDYVAITATAEAMTFAPRL
jgi:hypothetical protein